MTEYKKLTYIIIQEAMAERIRFLEDDLYNRAYKDIERLEVENDRLKVRCLDLQLENADYVWDATCVALLLLVQNQKIEDHTEDGGQNNERL